MRWISSILLLCGLLGVVSGCGSGSTHKGSAASRTTGSFADLVEHVKSGVIRIEVSSCSGSAIGTGFLIKPHLIATVEHVVDSAQTIKLKRNGADLGSATVIGLDKDRDLALLHTTKRIPGYDFSLARQAPRLGQDVAAIGFPLGLPLSVTKGSVSGLGRAIPIDGLKRRNMVQTDAAVNHGNSGGPLLATNTGKVVGLVDLGSTQANDIAFAVSAAVAAPLLQAWAIAPQSPASAVCNSSAGSSNSGGSSTVSSASTAAAYANAVEALTDLSAIIDQRRELLQAVTNVPAPSPFTRSAELLRASLITSLSDDLAIENWVKATYGGDTDAANRYWQQQLKLSTQASAAKQRFLDTYNARRASLLGLPPLDVAY
jgi:S1-C subfamily serine protease